MSAESSPPTAASPGALPLPLPSPPPLPRGPARTARLAILAAEFNREIMDTMLAAARDEARSRGAQIVVEIGVPGSYELPLPIDVVLGRADVDAAVALGYIERGETGHGEVMGHAVHRALLDASLRHRKPIGFGFIGPGALPRQAEKRKDDYARAAVRAAVRMLDVLAELERERPKSGRNTEQRRRGAKR